EQSRADDDRAEVRQRERRDADLPPFPRHADPVHDHAPRRDADERDGAEAAEKARAAKDAAVVETVDGHAVVAAVEAFPEQGQTAGVSVKRPRPRLVDDASAGRTELVEEEVAAAVAADARVERMRQKHLAPEGDVVE